MVLKKLLGTFAAIVLAAGLAAGCGKADTAPNEAQTPLLRQKALKPKRQMRKAKILRRQKQKAAMPQRQKQKPTVRKQTPRKRNPLPLRWKLSRKRSSWIRTISK